MKLTADLLPEERSAVITVSYPMVNKTDEIIDSLHLNWGPEDLLKKKVNLFTLNGKSPKLGKRFEDFGYEIYAFDPPLQPKDTVTMVLEVYAYYKGFPNEGSASTIVYNGTFMNNDFFPSFGDNTDGELTSDQDRKKVWLANQRLPISSAAGSLGHQQFAF